jgi:HlyD family secretion protein
MEILKRETNMKKNIKTVIFILAVLILSIIAYLMLSKDKEAVEVSTMNAYYGSVTKNIELSGVIKSADYEEISISSELKVVKTYVEENSIVEKGQLLAELDSTELLIELKKSEISLEELYSDLDRIKNGDSQVSILKNKLLKSQEDYNNVKSDLDTSYEDLKKISALYKENAISKMEYDRYVSAAKDLESKLSIAKLDYSDAETNYNDYIENIQIDTMNTGRDINTIKLDIESINNKIENNKIYASVSGVVTEFPLNEGRKTSVGSKIIIYDTTSYEFTAKAPQEDAVLIREGQNSMLYADGMSIIYEGEVINVGKTAEIDQNSGSKTPKVEITIKITNSDNFIKSGYEGKANIIIDISENALLLKNESLKRDSDGKMYLFVLKNGIVEKKFVATGLSDGYLTEVSGISEGEKVILSPPEELIDGDSVKLKN